MSATTTLLSMTIECLPTSENNIKSSFHIMVNQTPSGEFELVTTAPGQSSITMMHKNNPRVLDLGCVLYRHYGLHYDFPTLQLSSAQWEKTHVLEGEVALSSLKKIVENHKLRMRFMLGDNLDFEPKTGPKNSSLVLASFAFKPLKQKQDLTPASVI
jgi:hypothetical protein